MRGFLFIMNILDRIRLFFWKRRALNAFVSGQFETAYSCFSRIKQRWQDFPGIDYNLGLTALALKRYNEAENFLRCALVYDSSYPIRRALADTFYLAGRIEDARNSYKQALEDAPAIRDKNVILRRLEICSNDTDYSTAMQSWRLLDTALQLERERDHDSAAKVYEQAFSLDNTNFIAANNLGGYLMNVKGDYNRALRFFKQADKLAEHPVVRANIHKLQQILEKS